MIIKSNKFDKEINLDIDTHYSIVIENPIFYRTFYYSLKEQLNNGEEYLLYLIKNNEIGNLSKDAYLIDNPLQIELDEKKLNTIVQKKIAIEQNVEGKEKYQELLFRINEYISSITYDNSLPLTFDDEMTLVNFLKAVNLTILNSANNIIENFIFQLRKLSCIFGYKIFFIMNLYDYFSLKEINQIYEELKRLEIKVINISSHLPKAKNDEEFIIYIDEDLAELHL